MKNAGCIGLAFGNVDQGQLLQCHRMTVKEFERLMGQLLGIVNQSEFEKLLGGYEVTMSLVDSLKSIRTLASSPMESLRTIEARKQKEHEYLFWKHRGTWAARMGNWKAVLGPKKKTKRRQLELYDLCQDVGENNNLVEEHPEIAARMEASMNQAYEEPRPQREPKQAGGRRYR